MGVCSRFLNCTNGFKSRNAPHIEKQLLTDIETPPRKKDPVADISDKLENLQNFFIHELSDVRTEIKNVTRNKIPNLTKTK